MRFGNLSGIFTSGRLWSRPRCWILKSYYLKDAPKAILKGKSLESSGHVFDVECHTISPNLKYCFVRGKCVPQERTHNKPYELWICLHKESGEVVTAECNCVAG